MNTSSDRITRDNAPEGTFGTIGHPENNRYIVKTSNGRWRYTETGMFVDSEEFRGGWDVLYVPVG